MTTRVVIITSLKYQGDVDSFQDDPQYKGMKYLVFGTILSSLLSELQVIIPKTDRNGVCIGMLNRTLRAGVVLCFCNYVTGHD